MPSALLSRPNLTRRTLRAAIAGGLGYILVLVASAHWAYSNALTELWAALLSVQVGPFLWWGFLGGALVGAVLAVTIVQYGFLSPLLSVVLVYGVAMYQMWQALQAPYPLLPGTPLDIFFIGWPLLLGLALGSGLIERRVRAKQHASRIP